MKTKNAMVDRERLQQFRSRFGIKTDSDALKRFRVRVTQAARDSVRPLLGTERLALEKEFEVRSGLELILGTYYGGDPNVQVGVVERIEHAETFSDLVECIQNLLWSCESLGYFGKERYYNERDEAGLIFAGSLSRALELSPGIDLRVDASPGRVEIAPAGVALLDDVVDRATEWLSRYPDVQKEVCQALAILAEKKRAQFRQAQDSLRFALEKLLKLLLKNELRLEDQAKPLKEWLAKKRVHENLRDVAVQIMVLITRRYQNAAVKHDNKVADGAEKSWNEFEVEYMVYQYATLIRLLIEADGAGG